MTNRHRRRRPPLKRIERALRRLPGGADDLLRRVEITFIDDAAIADLAGAWRGSPHPTDVLAFPYEAGEVMGEILISLDTAARQARARGVPLADELILLCVHGLLHLGGIDDEHERGWRAMRVAEFETLMGIL